MRGTETVTSYPLMGKVRRNSCRNSAFSLKREKKKGKERSRMASSSPLPFPFFPGKEKGGRERVGMHCTFHILLTEKEKKEKKKRGRSMTAFMTSPYSVSSDRKRGKKERGEREKPRLKRRIVAVQDSPIVNAIH